MLRSLILTLALLPGAQLLFGQVNYTVTTGTSVTLSNSQGCSSSTYTFTQTNANCTGGPSCNQSNINAGAAVSVIFPAGTDISAVTSGTWNGTAIASFSKSGTTLSFTAPTSVAKNTSFTYVINSVVNPSAASGTGNIETGVINNSGGTTTFRYNLSTTSCPVIINPIPASEIFFGQNAWMPDAIGNTTSCPGGTTNPCSLYGKLHLAWNTVKQSNPRIIRFGGINPDNNFPTNDQYIRMIDSIRKIGAEPLLQVSFWNGTYTATQAANLVNYINNTMGRKVVYWSIGNEPDLKYSNHNTPVAVATYIKNFSRAMKDVDPTIKILAPEVAWYNPTIFYGNGSTGILIPGGANDITGKPSDRNYFYVDIITFHSYLGNGSHTRNDVVTNFPTTVKNDLDELNNRLNTANTFHNRSGENRLKTAITEFHVNYQNPSSNTVTGVGSHGFVTGQYWAEIFAAGMSRGLAFITPWSIHESSGNRGTYDLGYLDGDNPFIPRATFYHMQMMANHMRGTFLQGSTNRANVKAFATTDENSIAVMILNQETTGELDFTIRFDNGTVSGGDALKINIPAGLNKQFLERISSKTSALYLFDKLGNPTGRYIYSEANAAAATVRPPSWQVYDSFLHMEGLFSSSSSPGWIIENKEWNRTYYGLNRTEDQLQVAVNVGSNNTTGKFTRVFARTSTRISGGSLDLGSSTSLNLKLRTTAANCSLRVELQDNLGNITSSSPMLINPVNNNGTYNNYSYDFSNALSCGTGCTVNKSAIAVINFFVSYSSSAFNNSFDIGGMDFLPAVITAENIGNFNNSGQMSDVTFFPNPFTNEVTITISDKQARFVHINISDLQGRIVQQFQAETNKPMNVGYGLLPGIYVVSTDSERGIHFKITKY